eukprot:349801-Chlamydomonas_euryale.AAC.29
MHAWKVAWLHAVVEIKTVKPLLALPRWACAQELQSTRFIVCRFAPCRRAVHNAILCEAARLGRGQSIFLVLRHTAAVAHHSLAIESHAAVDAREGLTTALVEVLAQCGLCIGRGGGGGGKAMKGRFGRGCRRGIAGGQRSGRAGKAPFQVFAQFMSQVMQMQIIQLLCAVVTGQALGWKRVEELPPHSGGWRRRHFVLQVLRLACPDPLAPATCLLN